MGGKKKYINIFGSFMEPFNCPPLQVSQSCQFFYTEHLTHDMSFKSLHNVNRQSYAY